MDWWWDLLKAMDAHEGQAAWAQGFFSVLAIGAAILIDQGAARRLRNDRAKADKVARDARIRCLENCASSLRAAADEMDSAPATESKAFMLSPAARLALKAAAELVAVYQRTTWEADPRVLVALTYAGQIMADAEAYVERVGVVFARQKPDFVAKLRELAADVSALREGTDSCEV